MPIIGKRNAGLIGPYRLRNFGDDLIGLVLAAHLKRIGFDEVWMHDIAEANADLAGARVRDRSAIIRRADLVVIGGGHILGDGSHVPSVFYQRLAFQAAIVRWVLGNKQTVICGVGAGPLAKRRSRLYARLACRLVRSVGVRDPESARYVTDVLGCRESKLVEGADLALLWPEVFGIDSTTEMKRSAVGVQMDWPKERQPSGIEIPRSDIDNYANCVRYLSNGRKTTRAKSLLGIAGIETTYNSMPQFLDALLHCRVVVTTHLHIAIAAYAARIPGFTVATNPKTRRFYEQIGHPERCLDAVGDGREKLAGLAVEVLRRAALGVGWSSGDEERLNELKGKSRRLLTGIGDNLDAVFTR